MTREELYYSMTMKMLAEKAEKMGVKIDKKGSKQKAVEKMLAAEAAMEQELLKEAQKVAKTESTLSVPMPVESSENGPQLIEKEAPEQSQKKERKSKKTFEELVAEIPSPGNVRFIRAKKGGVTVKLGTNNARAFRYTGKSLIVLNNELVANIDHEVKKAYILVEPTADNMKAIFTNYINLYHVNM